MRRACARDGVCCQAGQKWRRQLRAPPNDPGRLPNRPTAYFFGIADFTKGFLQPEMYLASRSSKPGFTRLNHLGLGERGAILHAVGNEDARRIAGEEHEAALVLPGGLARGIAVAVDALALLTGHDDIGQPLAGRVGGPELLESRIVLRENLRGDQQRADRRDQGKLVHFAPLRWLPTSTGTCARGRSKARRLAPLRRLTALRAQSAATSHDVCRSRFTTSSCTGIAYDNSMTGENNSWLKRFM